MFAEDWLAHLHGPLVRPRCKATPSVVGAPVTDLEDILRERLRQFPFVRLYREFRKTAYLMVGIPDYENYVRHRRMLHPGEPMMTRPEFIRERTARRYGGGGVGRCC